MFSCLVPQVPPMPAEQVLSLLQAELQGRPLEDIFDWINLQTPLGSASIAQVGLLHRVFVGGQTCGPLLHCLT